MHWNPERSHFFTSKLCPNIFQLRKKSSKMLFSPRIFSEKCFSKKSGKINKFEIRKKIENFFSDFFGKSIFLRWLNWNTKIIWLGVVIPLDKRVLSIDENREKAWMHLGKIVKLDAAISRSVAWDCTNGFDWGGRQFERGAFFDPRVLWWPVLGR